MTRAPESSSISTSTLAAEPLTAADLERRTVDVEIVVEDVGVGLRGGFRGGEVVVVDREGRVLDCPDIDSDGRGRRIGLAAADRHMDGARRGRGIRIVDVRIAQRLDQGRDPGRRRIGGVEIDDQVVAAGPVRTDRADCGAADRDDAADIRAVRKGDGAGRVDAEHVFRGRPAGGDRNDEAAVLEIGVVVGEHGRDAGVEQHGGRTLGEADLVAVEIDEHWRRVKSRPAEDHIGLAGIGAAIVAGQRADDEVVKAVAVDVAGRGNAPAGQVAVGIALDDEPVGRREAGKVDRGEPCRFAEDDIGLAGIDAAIVAARRADDEVVKSVAIDVAGRRDAPARIVAGGIALDDEPVGRGEGGKVDRAEPCRFAEDDIGLAGIAAAIVAVRGADDEVVIAVAVDVARRGDAEAGLVAVCVALDDEPVGGGEAGKVDRAEACRFAEDDIGLADIVEAAVVAISGADDQVVIAVTIDVAGRRDAVPGAVVGGIALDDEAVGRGEAR